MREPGPSDELSLESTATLLSRARAGDERAVRVLVDRCSRPGFDAILSRMLPRLERLRPERRDALEELLRRGLLSLLAGAETSETPKAHGSDWQPIPLEEALDPETVARYESALRTLDGSDRVAIIARVELGLDYPRIAEILETPSAEAARLAVSGALCRLAEGMQEKADGRTK